MTRIWYAIDANNSQPLQNRKSALFFPFQAQYPVLRLVGFGVKMMTWLGTSPPTKENS